YGELRRADVGGEEKVDVRDGAERVGGVKHPIVIVGNGSGITGVKEEVFALKGGVWTAVNVPAGDNGSAELVGVVVVFVDGVDGPRGLGPADAAGGGGNQAFAEPPAVVFTAGAGDELVVDLFASTLAD